MSLGVDQKTASSRSFRKGGRKLSPRDRFEDVAIDSVETPQPQRDSDQLSFAITSGKGGVGKTNIAVNLGLCLQARGWRTTLVDLDMGLANADLLLGVTPRCDLRDVIDRGRDISEAIHTAEGGLSFVAGALGARRRTPLTDVTRASVIDQIGQLPGDITLLDCAAGIDDNVIGFAQSADAILVVTTPEPTALTDAYATIKTLLTEGYSGSIQVLVNMVETRHEARDAYNRIREVCEKFLNFSVADAGYVLHDTHVELAVRRRSAFAAEFPRCSASICVAAIAARLTGGRRTATQPQGLFKQLISMFV